MEQPFEGFAALEAEIDPNVVDVRGLIDRVIPLDRDAKVPLRPWVGLLTDMTPLEKMQKTRLRIIDMWTRVVRLQKKYGIVDGIDERQISPIPNATEAKASDVGDDRDRITRLQQAVTALENAVQAANLGPQ